MSYIKSLQFLQDILKIQDVLLQGEFLTRMFLIVDGKVNTRLILRF